MKSASSQTRQRGQSHCRAVDFSSSLNTSASYSAYYRDRVRTAFRDPQDTVSDTQIARKTKKAQRVCSFLGANIGRCKLTISREQLLRQLQAANDGYLHALTRVFETAHGVRGPEKHASLAVRLAEHICPLPLTDAPVSRTSLSCTETARPVPSRLLSLLSSVRPIRTLLVLRPRPSWSIRRPCPSAPTLTQRKLV